MEKKLKGQYASSKSRIQKMKPSCTDLHNKMVKIMKVPFEQLNIQSYNNAIFE